MSSTKVSGYPRARSIRAPSNGCCSTVGNCSKSKSWRRPTVPQYSMSPPRREAWPLIAASTASACLIRTGEEVNSVRSVQAASRVRDGDAGSVMVRRCSVRSSFNRWTSDASIPIGGETGRDPWKRGNRVPLASPNWRAEQIGSVRARSDGVDQIAPGGWQCEWALSQSVAEASG